MKLGSKLEVWRAEHRRDAYTDPTGMERDGYVVLERQVIEVIGHMEHKDPYTGHVDPEGRYLARDAEDRTYVGTPPTDYWGGTSWVRGEREFFGRAPYSLKGYFFADGSPAKRLLDETERPVTSVVPSEGEADGDEREAAPGDAERRD